MSCPLARETAGPGEGAPLRGLLPQLLLAKYPGDEAAPHSGWRLRAGPRTGGLPVRGPRADEVSERPPPVQGLPLATSRPAQGSPCTTPMRYVSYFQHRVQPPGPQKFRDEASGYSRPLPPHVPKPAALRPRVPGVP